MPSSQSVTQTLEQLRSPRSRLTLGVAAAAAAMLASVGGTASASAATTASAHSAVAKVSHVAPFSAYRVPAVDQPAPSVRIGAGMQLVAVPAPSHAATAVQASAPPQPATTPAVAPVTGTVVPSQPAAPAPAPAAPAPAAPAPAPPPQPYQLYDSVTPSAIPSSSQAVAVYANGHYAAAPGQVGKRGLVLWIDTNGSNPRADVLDVEPGDATPPQAAAWVEQKLNASPNSTAIVYTMRSQWGAVQDAVSHLAWWMPSHTKYWIADPTGVPHIVPGSDATQWYWGQNYDISTAQPGFN